MEIGEKGGSDCLPSEAVGAGLAAGSSKRRLLHITYYLLLSSLMCWDEMIPPTPVIDWSG